MNQRINFSKRGQWVLDSHQNQYQNQMGPQFKIDYSSKNPTQNEIQKANQSLQLLKQKMYRTQKLRNKTPVKPNGYPTKKIQSQIDLPSNYRKVYKPQVSLNDNNMNRNDQQILDSLNQLNQRIDNNKFNSNRNNNTQNQPKKNYQNNKQSFNNKQSNYDPYKNIKEYNNKPNDTKKQIIEMYKQSVLENQVKNFQSKNQYQKQNTYDTSYNQQQPPRQNDYSSKRQNMQQKNQNMYNKQSKFQQDNYGYDQGQYQDQNNGYSGNQYQDQDFDRNYQQKKQSRVQKQDNNMKNPNTFNSKQHYTQNKDKTKNSKYNVKRPVPQRDVSPEDDFADDGFQNNDIKDENQRILEEAEKLKNAQLYPCSKGCGRKFIKDALVKHQKICEKMQKKKRKVFDSHQQRKNLEGVQMNDIKKVTNKKLKQIQKEKKQKKVPKWKLESAQLRQQIMAARGVPNKQNVKQMEEQNKLLQQYQESSMIKCKFCGRTFNESAGKRHIVHCEKKAKENQFKQKNSKAKPQTKRPIKKRYQLKYFINLKISKQNSL